MRTLCLLCLLTPATALAAGAQSETEYYAIFLDGKKIGHSTRTRRVTGGRVVTIETAKMTVGRGQLPMTVSQSETCIETDKGEPLGFESVQDFGLMAQKTKGTVAPDGKLTVTTIFSGKEQVRTLDWPEGALMAEGLRLLTEKMGLSAGVSYQQKLFIPAMLEATTVNVTVGQTAKVDLLGRVVPLTELTTTLSALTGPVTTISYVDRRLRSLKTITPVMGMTVEMIACNKAFALSENDVVDFLAKTILPSPVPLDGIAAASSATYRLEPTGRKKLAGMIATDSQTVQPDGKGGVIVKVAPAKAPAGVKFPYKGTDAEIVAATKPTRWVQSDDKQVIALARKAVGKETDAAKAARKVERFVGQYITKKNLSVGYATAAEVAAGREGDCSEHAVLTAAMCRAVGIPARVVVGYVYANKMMGYSNVFGPHAWVEAYVGRKWIGLDATRGGVGPGHIAQAAGNGDPAGFFGIITSMGSFKIVEVTVRQ